MTVTPEMREWANAYVFACADVAAMKGEPFDPEAATAAIREALLNPVYNPALDLDPDVDDGNRDPSGEQADRAAGYHYARDLGDLR